MSAGYVLSLEAARDRDEIFVYLAEQKNLDTALRIEQELEAAFDLLASRPYAGHTRQDLYLPKTVRVWAVYSWLICLPTRHLASPHSPHLARRARKA